MKNVLIFLGGAICGAAGALLWLRKDFNEKLEEAESRTNEIMKQVNENTKQIEKNTKKVQKAASTLQKKARDYSKMCEKLEYKATDASRSDVEALIRDSKSEDDIVDDESDIPFNGPSEPSKDVPYAISDKDFIHDGKEDYDKITLFYYRGDDILAEEDGTVVEDWKYNVGEDWKDAIGKFVEDEAFIRNERRSTDFNIVCEDLSYSDEFGENE